MKEPLLEVRDLKTFFYTWRGIIRAVNGVSLTVHRREIFGIVGETGAGKSVTALSILKLVPPPGYIAGGKIFFEGEEILGKNEKEMQRIRGNKIGMIFQDPLKALNPVIKVGEQVAETLIIHRNINKFSALNTAISLLKVLGIPDPEEVAKKYPYELSGGMRQRVQIAAALACRPSLLIADEPTSSVDPPIQLQILRVLKEIREKYNTAILLITHNLGVAFEICDRIAVMYKGEIVEETNASEFFENPLHPYSKLLINAAFEINSGRCKWSEKTYKHSNHYACKFYERCPDKIKPCKNLPPENIKVNKDHVVKCHLYSAYSKKK
ncbi:MAG: ABC transporter ATP-binding protein [Candidatus Odinarchaeia archaeon]